MKTNERNIVEEIYQIIKNNIDLNIVLFFKIEVLLSENDTFYYINKIYVFPPTSAY